MYIEVTAIKMYLLINIKHNIIIQCHGNYIEVKTIQYSTGN